MILVDTNVILASLVSSRGASFKLLERMLDGDIEFLMSLKLFSEYWGVVTRHENLKLIPLAMKELESLFALIVQKASYQEVYYLWRPNLKDENDNFILELAIAGHAESIVTFNKKDFLSSQMKFDLLIESPGEFLKRRGFL